MPSDLNIRRKNNPLELVNKSHENYDEIAGLELGFINGDKAKTERLIALYYKRIFLNCFRLARDFHIAEDLTNETFLRAHKYKASYETDKKFVFWLLKISTNVCMDYLKKLCWEKRNFISIDLFEKNFTSLSNLQKYIIDEKSSAGFDEKIKNEVINNAVLILPLIYKTIIILKYYNDLNCEEISNIMNMPVGTVKVKLSKARVILAELLKCMRE